MRKRVAEKILKYKEKLNYSESQVRRAEETLGEIEKRREKRKSRTELPSTEGGE